MVKVLVRVRPTAQPVVGVEGDEVVVERAGQSRFRFHGAFGPESTQEEVFESVREDLDKASEGFGLTVFAYGQTSSGKTHTICGTHESPGIVPRAVSRLFATHGDDALYSLTYCEIYKEQIYDLFEVSPKRAALPVVAFQVPGLRRMYCKSPEEALRLWGAASERRVTAATERNSQSSRSHSILTLHVEAKDRVVAVRLVDLAGSEKDNGRAEETKAINESLIHLSNILELLAKKGKGPPVHIPYRNSKLTSVLKDALGGSSMCVMVACLRADSKYVAESVNTLRYALRATHIVNAVRKLGDKNLRTAVGESATRMSSAQLEELYEAMLAAPDDTRGHLRLLSTIMGRRPDDFVHPALRRFVSETMRGSGAEERLAGSGAETGAPLARVVLRSD